MMVGTNGNMYFNLYNNDVTLGITFTQTHKDDKKEQYMVRYSFEHLDMLDEMLILIQIQ